MLAVFFLCDSELWYTGCMKTDAQFKEAYKKLNEAQKRAVDAVDGPVMVVAGPGTGKTQVLALRIANIIDKTDTPPSGVLCLTFTNAGVTAMRERLLRLMGSRGNEVNVATFHRFGISLIEKYYGFLGFDQAPTLLSDTEAIGLADEILESGTWTHIRPRSDSSKYFSDIRSLISLLKREALSPSDFLAQVSVAIEEIQNNPENISSRGARKGELKREAEAEISALARTQEVVQFYEEYERIKEKRGLMDYDDVLAYAVRLVKESEDARSFVRENFLYVLVDEHQDSSGVQNSFLEAVWGDTERPNIFVVGDDRQLIYGFGGASLEQFVKFRSAFGAAEEITLTHNYRSPQIVLSAADALLKSSLAEAPLQSTPARQGEKIRVVESAYQRDEIIAIAHDIQKKVAEGAELSECAILLPKNYQVRSAVGILRDQGLPVTAGDKVSFFAQPETQTIYNILRAIADPLDGAPFGDLLFDTHMQIPPLSAHRYLRDHLRKVSLETLSAYGATRLPTDPLARLGVSLQDWLVQAETLGVHGLIQNIGDQLFFEKTTNHSDLVRQVEIIRTFLHLVISQQEKYPNMNVRQFVAYLDRLKQYGHEIPLAIFTAEQGVRVLSLHGSKGLEFNHVYIAHLDESSLMKGKKGGFALPERMEALVEKKNELAARRELYVAITRAKETCWLSYAKYTYTGGELAMAPLLADIPEEYTEKIILQEAEAEILSTRPQRLVESKAQAVQTTRAELANLVKDEYAKTNVSVTLLNNFFECPWKWYFRNILQIPERKSESLLLGSVVHAGIEYCIKHREEIDEKALAEVLSSALVKEYAYGEQLTRRILKDSNAIIARFRTAHLPTFHTDAVSERSVSYRNPKRAHLSCYGKIDLTEKLSNNLVQVTDFKTGKSKAPSAIEKRDDEGRLGSLARQLAMYSYLIENAERGTTVASSKLLFLEEDAKEKNAVYAKTVSPEELSLLEKDIADYDTYIQDGTWVERPCYTVSYGAGQECEHCAKARELYQ